MTKTKIDYLLEKRKKLQERIKQEELCEPISKAIEYLKLNNFNFNIHYKAHNLNWIADNLKVRNKNGYNGSHGDFQIDVDDNSVDICIKLKSENDFLKTSSIMSFLNTQSKGQNLIVCSLSSFAEVEISQKIFLSQPSVFFTNPETWVIDNEKSIIIEYIWKQEIVRFINVENKENPKLELKALIE